MRLRIRENALCAFLAAAGCATMAWLGLYGFAWNDYETEARPAFEALTHGHVLEIPASRAGLRRLAAWSARRSRCCPGCGVAASSRSTAWSRCPVCWRPPCSGCGWSRGCAPLGAPTLARAVALGVCVANPLTLRALELGHPEELLGGVLCVGRGAARRA